MAVDPKVRALRALAEHMAERLSVGERPLAWQQLHGQALLLADAAQALHDLATRRNPTETDGAHVKRVATAAAKLAKEADAALARANRIAHDGMFNITQRVKAKVRLVPDAYASEVRAAYRAMSGTEQTATLTALVNENRGPEIAAIIKAPGLLTGMSDHHRKQYEAAFISRHAPEEQREEAALMEAFEAVLVSTKTAGEVARDFSDPAALAEITRAEAAAAAAAKAFDAKVSGA